MTLQEKEILNFYLFGVILISILIVLGAGMHNWSKYTYSKITAIEESLK